MELTSEFKKNVKATVESKGLTEDIKIDFILQYARVEILQQIVDTKAKEINEARMGASSGC